MPQEFCIGEEWGEWTSNIGEALPRLATLLAIRDIQTAGGTPMDLIENTEMMILECVAELAGNAARVGVHIESARKSRRARDN